MKNDKLWEKYCGFLEKDFQEQIEFSERKLKDFLSRWMNTKTKDLILKGKTANRIEDIPTTTFDDYSILQDFSNAITKFIKKHPRKEGEPLINYYGKVSNYVNNIIKDFLPSEFVYPLKTTGTTGESKWIPQTKEVEKITRKTFMTLLIISSSTEWGKTKLQKGDVLLSLAAPIPYSTGYGTYVLSSYLKIFPPPHILESSKGMFEKLRYVIKEIKKGKKIDFIFGFPAILHMFADALTSPTKMYMEQYKSLPFGLPKIAMFLFYLKEKMMKHESKNITDYFQPKGIITGGFDVKLYLEFIKEEYGVNPVNFYGSTEIGGAMLSPPGKPDYLLPLLEVGYWEFMDSKGEIWKIDELRKGEFYELVATPFGNMFVRYRTGDVFSVVEFRDDGLPIFTFQGRKTEIIDIRNYIRLTAGMAENVLEKAGLRKTDKWVVTKVMEGDEKIMFLMEKVWDCDEREAEKRIFEAMKIYEDFQNYIKDFKIRNAGEIIKVKYLRKGVFARYALRKMKEGKPLGQYKPPKVIPPERKEIIDELLED